MTQWNESLQHQNIALALIGLFWIDFIFFYINKKVETWKRFLFQLDLRNFLLRT